jgi:hypothetical protein
MTQYSLAPAFFIISSHNVWAPHKMTVPVRAWGDNVVAGGSGTFTNWEDDGIDADAMIQAFCALLQPVFPTDWTFDSYTIYTKADEESPSNPVAFKEIALDGENVAAYVPATQSTWSFRTENLNRWKLVFLDLPVPTGFAKTLPADLTADGEAIVDFVTDTANAFSGRDNSRPIGFISATATLNEKLRREYRLV